MGVAMQQGKDNDVKCIDDISGDTKGSLDGAGNGSQEGKADLGQASEKDIAHNRDQ